MSAIGSGGSSYIAPQFNTSVNKSGTTQLINTIKTEDPTSGEVKLTKEDFKTLAKQFKGGKEELGKLLEGISPKEDIDKLKAFTFAFDGKSTNITLTGSQKDEFISRLDGLLNNMKSSEDGDLDATSKALGNKLKTFSGEIGESTERSTVIKLGAQVSGSLGSSVAKDTDWETPLGLSNTDGLAAELGIEGSVGVKSSAKSLEGGKIQISYEFQALAEGKGKASLFKVAQHEGNQEIGAGIGSKKTVNYTFDNVQDAVDFLKDKGKGFSVGDSTGAKTYTVEKTGFQKLTTKSSQTSDSVEVKKTSEVASGWYSSVKNFFGNVFGFRSVQVSSFKKEKVGDESTKTFSLDTKSKFLSFEKRTTSTNLVVTKNKDKTTGQETFSGNFSMDVNIEKIKNNSDRVGLINKLVSRFEQVADKFNQDTYSTKTGGLDRTSIRSYITNTVDKLLKSEGLFKSDESGTLQSTKSGKKIGDKSVDQFKAEVAGNVGIGGSIELKVTKSEMIRINIPLETKNGKLSPIDSSSKVQISELNTLGVGAGVEFEIGSEGIAGAKAAVKLGFEKGSATMRNVIDATKTSVSDDTGTKLEPFLLKRTEALSKESTANTFKIEAKQAFSEYKSIKKEIESIDKQIKELESTKPEGKKFDVLMDIGDKISELKSLKQTKVVLANEKLNLSEEKINNAKTSIGEAKTIVKDSLDGIKDLYDNAIQNKTLRTELSTAQTKNLSIIQNSKVIDSISKEIEFEKL